MSERDRQIIDAFNTTTDKPTGKSSLTLEKLRKARRILEEAGGEDGGRWTVNCSRQQYNDLAELLKSDNPPEWAKHIKLEPRG